MPYLRESWQHLENTMKSLLHFTPDRLIKEYILISDGNPPEHVHEEQLSSMSPKVRVVKNEQRMGLILAKMKAVDMAQGSILMFMEGHCIVNRQWLEPLIVRLQEFPRALVQPTLDIIPQDNFFQYYKGMQGHWRFEWNMNLIYTKPPDPSEFSMQEHRPQPSPATSGGIFAIRRDWWKTLGFYDPEMLEWGGDHVEATMKVWRCGGHIDVHPCSRVGHLFRDVEHRPYNVEVTQIVRNYARLANVWWDDGLRTFYKLKPDALQYDIGDISAQRAQRKALGCKDMSWYLEHVDPELAWEQSRACIPGASKAHGGCDRRTAAQGRSSVDQTIPAEEYRQRRAEIKAYFEDHGFDDASEDEL